MQHEDPPTTSTDDLSPQDMSWAARKKAQATWRFRVKHMTRSQRRERAAHFWELRRGLRDGTLVPLTSTDGLGFRGRCKLIHN